MTVALEQQWPVDVQVGLEVGAKGVRDGEGEGPIVFSFHRP